MSPAIRVAVYSVGVLASWVGAGLCGYRLGGALVALANATKNAAK